MTPWTVTPKAPLSTEFSSQEYWSGLPFPSSGDLPHPGIEPGSPTLQADSLLTEPARKPFLNSPDGKSRSFSGSNWKSEERIEGVLEWSKQEGEALITHMQFTCLVYSCSLDWVPWLSLARTHVTHGKPGPSVLLFITYQPYQSWFGRKSL